MQALTDAVKRRYPGVVIYGIGNEEHQLHASDHNEDDTAGSRPAQTDADSTKEHRALDIMLGPAFTKAQAYQLIADLLGDPAARARLKYIIFDGYIWSASNGWVREEFDGDPHRDHPHISGKASDDENAAGWPAVDKGKEEDMGVLGLKYDDRGERVKELQYTLELAGYDVGTVDGHYGAKTAAAVKACCGGTDGKAIFGIHAARLNAALAKAQAKPGPQGLQGVPGKDGKDGVLTLPAEFVFHGSVRPAE